MPKVSNVTALKVHPAAEFFGLIAANIAKSLRDLLAEISPNTCGQSPIHPRDGHTTPTHQSHGHIIS